MRAPRGLDMSKLTASVSLEEIVTICPLDLFYFSIHRVKIGTNWGSFLIIIADVLDYKFWWVSKQNLVAAGLIFGYVLYYLVARG